MMFPSPTDLLRTPGFVQDFSGSHMLSGDGSNGGRGGDIGSHNSATNSNNTTTINYYSPQFIVDSHGSALDLSMYDKTSVISHPFHGGDNQQWILSDDGDGEVTLRSKYNQSYVAVEKTEKGDILKSSINPFIWNIKQEGGRFQLAVPGSDFGLSLVDAATLKSIESPDTQIFILENTLQNADAIKNSRISPTIVRASNPQLNVGPSLPSNPSHLPMNGSHTGTTINIMLNGSSDRVFASATEKHELQQFMSSDGLKNLTICLGYHSPSSIPTVIPRTQQGPTLPSKSLSSPLTISDRSPVPMARVGQADIIGFGTSDIIFMRNNINMQPIHANLASFGLGAGWTMNKHIRLVADTTGNGKCDIVGFGDKGVYVSKNMGDNTFEEAKLVFSDFGYDCGGWRVEKHVRLMADICKTGRADIIGFGHAGVLVALNKGDGSYGPLKLALNAFGFASGWRIEKHPRFLVDVDGNGLLDIVGFGDEHVFVSRNNGDGTFKPVVIAVTSFCPAQGWQVDKHPRFIVPLIKGGKPDIIGFGHSDVYVSFNDGNGNFAPPRTVSKEFCYNFGWRVERHPRFVVDLTGNGCVDIIGFGQSGVYVSLNNGDGTFQGSKLVMKDFCYDTGWRVEKHPIFVVDMNGDGCADIVGFGESGVYVSFNNGKGSFGPIKKICDEFGFNASAWSMDRTVRYVANVF